MSFGVPDLRRSSQTPAALPTARSSSTARGNAAATELIAPKPDRVEWSKADGGANDLVGAVTHFARRNHATSAAHQSRSNSAEAVDATSGGRATLNEDHVRKAKVLHGLNFANEMETAAKKNGVDPILLAAVAAQETGGGGIQAHDIDQPNGLGRGPFQIDIGAWPDKASIAHDPAKSADFAAFLLKDGFRQAAIAGDAPKNSLERTKEALRTYNGSSPHAKTTSTQWPGGRIPYEDSVMRHYAQIVKYLASPASR